MPLRRSLRLFSYEFEIFLPQLLRDIPTISMTFFTHQTSGIDWQNPAYSVALHCAAASDRMDIVSYLLERGVDVNGRIGLEHYPNYSDTNPAPLYFAISRRRHEELVSNMTQLLLENGADPNLACNGHPGDAYIGDMVPLHQTAILGFAGTTRLLIKYGAKVDLKNRNGETPLLNACARKHGLVVAELLRAGADPLIPSIHRVTAQGFIDRSEELQAVYERVLSEAGTGPRGP